MNEIPLKTRTKIIVDFVKGMRAEDISFNERIPLDSVKNAIKEWEDGYLNVNIGNDVPTEIKDIAAMMRDNNLTVQDILEGYSYYEIFKDKEREKVIRIVDEIYGMNDSERRKFIDTAMRIISYRKYDNIDFTEIPKALEDMVYRGKEINREIKSREFHLLDLNKQIQDIEGQLKDMNKERDELAKEINLLKFLRENVGGDDDSVKNTIESLKHSGFDAESIRELSEYIVAIKGRGMNIEQFLKITRYFDDLMKLGLNVQMMEDLLDRVKESGMDIDDYLNERYAYVRDKSAYMKSVKELVDVHKKLEKDIKVLEEEIQKRKNKIERI